MHGASALTHMAALPKHSSLQKRQETTRKQRFDGAPRLDSEWELHEAPATQEKIKPRRKIVATAVCLLVFLPRPCSCQSGFCDLAKGVPDFDGLPKDRLLVARNNFSRNG